MSDKEFLIDISADDFDDALKSLGGNIPAPWIDPDSVDGPVPKIREARPNTRAPEVDPAVAQARAELARERAARQEAERKAQEALSKIRDADAYVLDNQYYAVASALKAVEGETEAVRKQKQDSLEAGDYKAATDLDVKLAEAVARKARLEEDKASVEAAGRRMVAAAKEAKAEPVVEAKPAAPQGDQVEAWIAGNNVHPRVAEQVREHRQLLLDPKVYALALGAHHISMGRGEEIGSDAYIARLLKTAGIKKAAQTPQAAAPEAEVDNEDDEMAADTQTEDVVVQAASAPKKAAAPARPAAPVSRVASPGTPLKPGQYKLTAEQFEMARELGMDPKKYAIIDGMIKANKGNPSFPKYTADRSR